MPPKMVKRKRLTASEVAYMMGLEPPATTADGKDIKYGRRALVGQYTRPYKREDGSDGVLDLSELINSKR